MLEIEPKTLRLAAARQVAYWTNRVTEEKEKLDIVLKEREADKQAQHWFRRWFWPEAVPYYDFTYWKHDTILELLQDALKQERQIQAVCEVAEATGQLVWFQKDWENLLPSIAIVTRNQRY
jgi:hypothetical protein